MLERLEILERGVSVGRVIDVDDAAFHRTEAIACTVRDAFNQLIVGDGNLISSEDFQRGLADDAGMEAADAALDEKQGSGFAHHLVRDGRAM